MPAVQETIDQVRRIDVDQYKYGFETLIEMDVAPKGLTEDTIRLISAKKDEPEWMLDWRLKAFERWKTMESPSWAPRLPADRLPGHPLLRRAEVDVGPGLAGRGRPRDPSHLRETRSLIPTWRNLAYCFWADMARYRC